PVAVSIFRQQPVANVLPSGEKATERTETSLWANDCTTFSVSKSQRSIEGSSMNTGSMTKVLRSGEAHRLVTTPWTSTVSRVAANLPSISHSFTVPSL